ncbi:MAG: LD-carboxypeptidase [Pseudomonadota bacterium]|nr:LD-carboxypeptidase [Pseudomonadota bacterium]
MTAGSRTVGLVAPAGYVPDVTSIDRARDRLEGLGYRVKIDPSCTTRWQRFSGHDRERVAAVMRMAEDPEIDLVVTARGGYGWSRLLDQLDYRAIASAGKRWMGHSDFTAFQLAAFAHAGMVSFGGPMASYDFGAAEPSAFTFDHFQRMYETGEDTVECALEGPDFVGEGTLWGGNLAMVAHLVGSTHLPDVRGGMLFLEDIAEHPYRIERMLHQLHFAGVLQRQRAVLLGTFNGFDVAPNDNGYDLAAVAAHAREHFGVAMFSGLPFGHCADKLTLPVGGHCRLTVHDGAGRIELAVARAH